MFALYIEGLSVLERSGLGHFARHSIWAYPVANVLHVLGAALVVGAIAVFDLALLSRRYDKAAQIGPVAIPIAATGLAIQVTTGLVLLAAEATRLGVNPAFYAKVALIAVGLVNVGVFHAHFGGGAGFRFLLDKARIPAFISLAAWILTLMAGRMIAYL